MTRRPITPQDLWALRRVGTRQWPPTGASRSSGDRVRRAGEPGPHPPVAVGRDGSTRPLTSGHRFHQPGPLPTPCTWLPAQGEGGRQTPAARAAPRRRRGPVPHRPPAGAAAPRWAPAGTYLVFPVPCSPGTRARRRPAPSWPPARSARCRRGSRGPRLPLLDRWLADGGVHHLFRIELDGSGLTDLTPGWQRPLDLEDPASAFDVAPDGEIAFHSLAVDRPYREIREAVFTLAPGGEARLSGPTARPGRSGPLLAAGSALAFGFAVDIPPSTLTGTGSACRIGPRGAHGPDRGLDRSCESWGGCPTGAACASPPRTTPGGACSPSGRRGDAGAAGPGRLADRPHPAGDGPVWCCTSR